MKSNKKALAIILVVVVGCSANGLSVFASNSNWGSEHKRSHSSQVPLKLESDISASPIKAQDSLTVDEVLNNPQYKSLTFDRDAVTLFKEIEEFKKDNPRMTSNEIIRHFDSKLDNRQQDNLISGKAIYDPYVTKWKELTNAEQILVVTSPGQALLVDYCRNSAVTYSDNSAYGSLNGNGTKKDAFRHAIWNALMCKYINKLSAYTWASAHEMQNDPNYYTTVFDGFTGLQHKNMDLHNNEKGRDCWNILTDGILWTSDQTLQNRVAAKIEAGQMVVLR